MRSLACPALVGLLALAGCGGAPPPPVTSASPAARAAPSPAAVSTSAVPSTEHRLSRAAIHRAIVAGLGGLLRHVVVDDRPVLVSGKFHGFRIAALPDATFWAGVDLAPGDVVTGVNGLPIERPEQAQTAFESLEVASELRVSCERDGQEHDLVYAIVDDR